jgi:hypothetical protein
MDIEGSAEINTFHEKDGHARPSLIAGSICLMFVLVEVVFLVRLCASIWLGKPLAEPLKQLDFVLSACAFQVCFLGAAVGYLSILRGRPLIARRNKAKFNSEQMVSMLVMMLLLSLMMFSNFTALCEKVRP